MLRRIGYGLQAVRRFRVRDLQEKGVEILLSTPCECFSSRNRIKESGAGWHQVRLTLLLDRQ